MRLNKISLLALSLTLACSLTAPAAFAAKNAPAPAASPMHLETSRNEAQEVAAINAALADLQAASNRHDIDGILRHYSPEFISGDGLTLKEMGALIRDTWDMFPDIKYESKVQEVRVSGKWATVESLDTATAKAKTDDAVSDKPGRLQSRSRGVLYLQKAGKTWEVISDYTQYEKAIITYGPVETVNVDVATPEQVFAGEAYSAKLDVDVPAGNIAFAMIAKEPLVYPQKADKNKFRTLSTEKTELERIFAANTSNNNEVITATIGFTQIGQDDQERPTINLAGIMTVIKRVNVIPKSAFGAAAARQENVRNAADGTVKTDSPDEEGGSEMDDGALDGEPGE